MFHSIFALNASGTEFLHALSICVLTPALLQDERVNTVHQEPKLQPVLYIRDVIDGMIECCVRYNVIVVDGFLSHSMIILQPEFLPAKRPASHPDTNARCMMRKTVFHPP